METAVTMVTACSLSLYLACVTVQERVCVYTVYTHNMYVFDGKPWGLFAGRLVVIVWSPCWLIPPTDTVDIKTSKADLRSGSATSGQSLELRTERRSDVSIRGGTWYDVTQGWSSGSAGIWRLCPSTEPGTGGSSSSPLVVQSWGGLDSTCGSLGHSHHRTAAGHHFPRCRKRCSTCTRCTASGMS